MILLWLACSPAPRPAAPVHPFPALAFPIAGVIGEDLWVPNRPDVDPGPTFRDHAGGTHTYDDHSGTDIGPQNAGAAVATWVTAPIAGKVLRVRDGVPDGELLAYGKPFVDDRECGNGVVIDAGAGWVVQLCHLLVGSVAVTVDQPVAVGARIGRVGWSGVADFPHVHLTVRHEDRDVDPFTGRYRDDGSAAAARPLWTSPIPAPGAIDSLVWAGFDAGPIPDDMPWPIDGGSGLVRASAPSLLFRVFLWRPEVGDVVVTEITNPDGDTTRSEAVQPRERPRQIWTIENTWPADHRPVGLWTAKVTWERAGRKRELRASTVLE